MPILGPASSAVTARGIIRDCLTFHLNRLSPGEAEDADLFSTCLRALNSIADEWSGAGSFLFREVLTESAAITGASALLGGDWPDLTTGTPILGATRNDGTTLDPLTLAQYHAITDKTTTGEPSSYAHDGADTVYLYPAATGQTITLRTREALSAFDDLDTEFSMPAGYRSAFAACLAERMAPTLAPEMLSSCAAKARVARSRIRTQNVKPAIIGGTVRRFDIARGW